MFVLQFHYLIIFSWSNTGFSITNRCDLGVMDSSHQIVRQIDCGNREVMKGNREIVG